MVFLVKVTIFRMSSECGGGGRQAYKIAEYYRSQTFLDKGDKGIDFSVRLTKSDHVITLSCLCGFERKKPEEKFSPASYFLGQDFSWGTCNSFAWSYLPSTPFRAFLFGESNRK